jgi:ABC-type lipoprotein release transport system permease subunit
MSLIIVLSVYNGFEGLIKSLYNSYEPDLLILPASGKTFAADSEIFNKIRISPNVFTFSEVIEENVFLRYRDEEAIATVKGVDSSFLKNSNFNKFIIDGEFSLYHGELEQAVVGRGIASKLGMNIHFIDPLYMYFPSGKSEISLINPAASLNSEKVFPAGIFSIEMGIDKKYVFLPITVVRRLLDYNNEVTSIEIQLNKGTDEESFQKEISKSLGSKYLVKNRFQQKETIYKMMKSEKLSIFIILIFILTIISFNIYGSLSMLILEKREDIVTFESMGADEKAIKKIFLFEGWLISLFGIAAGALLGIIITLLQKYFGIVAMPGSFIVDSYPVVLKCSDIAFSVIGVTLIGYLAARLPLNILKKSKNI